MICGDRVKLVLGKSLFAIQENCILELNEKSEVYRQFKHKKCSQLVWRYKSTNKKLGMKVELQLLE